MEEHEQVNEALDSLGEFGIEIEPGQPRQDDLEAILEGVSVRGAARRTSGAARRLIDNLLRYPRGEVEGRGGQFRPKRARGVVGVPSREQRIKDRDRLVQGLLSAAQKERKEASAAINRGQMGQALDRYEAARRLDQEAARVAVADTPREEINMDSPDVLTERQTPYEYPGPEEHEQLLRGELIDWLVFGAKVYANNPIRWEIDNGDPGPGPFFRGQPPNMGLKGPRSWSKNPSVALYHADRLILDRDDEGVVTTRMSLPNNDPSAGILVAGTGRVMAVEILMTNDVARPGFDLSERDTGYQWESEVILDAANWPKGAHATPIRIVIAGPGETVSDEEMYERVDKALREDHGYTGPKLRNPLAEAKAAAMDSPESGHPEVWRPGEKAHFQYHCHRGHDSCDRRLWYRDRSRVTILGLSDGEWKDYGLGGTTFSERGEMGMPAYYRIRFPDGYEFDAAEDELFTDPQYFTPEGDPNVQPPAPGLSEIEKHDPGYAAWLRAGGEKAAMDSPEILVSTARLDTALDDMDSPEVRSVYEEMERLGYPDYTLASWWQGKYGEPIDPSEVPEFVYRVMSEEHFNNSIADGVHQSDERGNWRGQGVSETPEGTVAGRWAYPGFLTNAERGIGRIVKIRVEPEDGWEYHADADDEGGYYRTLKPIPTERFESWTEPVALSPSVMASPDAEMWTDPATRGRLVGDLLFYSGIQWSDGSKGVVARNRDGEAVALLAYQVVTDTIRMDSGDMKSQRVILSDLKVLPEHRRMGLATQLVDEVRRLHPNLPLQSNARTPDGEAFFTSAPEIEIAPEYQEDLSSAGSPVPFPEWVIREDLKNANLKKEWVEKDFQEAERAAGMDSPYAVMTEDSERPVMYPLTQGEAEAQAADWPNQPARAAYLTDEEVRRLQREMAASLRGGMDSPGDPAFPDAAELGATVGHTPLSVEEIPGLLEVSDRAVTDSLERWPPLAGVARFYWSEDSLSRPFADFKAGDGVRLASGIPLREASTKDIADLLDAGQESRASHNLSIEVGMARRSQEVLIYDPGHIDNLSSNPFWTIFSRLAHRKSADAGFNTFTSDWEGFKEGGWGWPQKPAREYAVAAYEAIILHEIGHSVMYAIDPRRGNTRQARLARLFEDFGITPEMIEQEVSDYATVNLDETFAELYAYYFSDLHDEMDEELRLKFASLLRAKVPGHRLRPEEEAILPAMESPEVALPGAAEAGLQVSPRTPLAGSRQARLDTLDRELTRLLEAWPDLTANTGVFVADDEESRLVVTAVGAVLTETTPAEAARARNNTALAFTRLDANSERHIIMAFDKDPYAGGSGTVPARLAPRPQVRDTAPDGTRLYNSMEEIRDARAEANDAYWRLALIHEIGHVVHSTIVPYEGGLLEEYLSTLLALLQRYGITPEEIAEVSTYAALSSAEAFAEMFTLLLGAPDEMDPFLREKFIALLQAELPGLDLSKLLPAAIL